MYVSYYFGEEYKTSGLNDTFKKTTLTLGMTRYLWFTEYESSDVLIEILFVSLIHI